MPCYYPVPQPASQSVPIHYLYEILLLQSQWFLSLNSMESKTLVRAPHCADVWNRQGTGHTICRGIKCCVYWLSGSCLR